MNSVLPDVKERALPKRCESGIYLPPDALRGTAERPILTPETPLFPRINGAKVTGVRPCSPFLYRVSVTGQRPMSLSVVGLPPDLHFDATSGVLSGSFSKRGRHTIRIDAANAHGRATCDLRIVIGDDFCLTPPMGFNTYGGWGPFITEAQVRAGAKALIESGLADHGYQYVNIDDGWQGVRGGPLNAIQPNEKFGDLKRFCDDMHRLGFKTGIYSTPWTSSYEGFCGGSSRTADGAWLRPNPPRHGTCLFGQYRFENADARQWAEWGFDYAKYDWMINSPELARVMSEALREQSRDIVLELSNDAPIKDAGVYTTLAQMCRTTGDIVDVWERTQIEPEKRSWAHGVRDIWKQHRDWARFNRPGHWNMPCPLRVGVLGGWDLKPLQPTRLTVDEQYSHISLWALWSAPLIIGCPVERLDEFTLALLNNDEVIAVDQDPLGLQARDFAVEGGEVLVKDMEDGSKAVGLFCTGSEGAVVSVSWEQLGVTGPQRVRDVWRQKDIGVYVNLFAAQVNSHGVVLVSISPA
jgi:alpha-galactosidase